MNCVRIAWRGWRRRPLPPILVVLLLTIGIAPNVAVFTAVTHLLLSPLAVDRPGTLVSLGRLSYPNYESFAERLDGVTGVAAFIDMPLAPVHGTFVTSNYFTLLGIAAIQGRTFAPDAPGATSDTHAVVISERYWRAVHGADPKIIGRTLRFNDVAVTVIGVVPANFRGTTLEYAADAWVPLSLYPAMYPGFPDPREHRQVPSMNVFARRAEDTPLHRLRFNVTNLAGALAAEHPRDDPGERTADAVPLAQAVWSSARREEIVRITSLLQLAASAVFAIGLAHVFLLATASAEARRGEFAVRLVHGARWRHLVRQQAVEYLILGGAATACGLLVARWTLRFMVTVRIIPAPAPGSGDDFAILGFVILLHLAALGAGGVVPAFRIRRIEASSALRPAAATLAAASTRSGTLMKALLTIQFAVSFALVCVALLFVHTIRNKMQVDPGFEAAGVLRAGVIAPGGEDQVRTFRRTLVRELAEHPGIRRAAWGFAIPFDGVKFLAHVTRDGDADNRVLAIENPVGPGFFQVLGIPVLRGRGFMDADIGAPVTVISRRLAAQLWQERDPIGDRLRMAHDGMLFDVVGIAGDSRYHSLHGESLPVAYFPPDDTVAFGHVVAQADGRPAAAAAVIRNRIAALDSEAGTPDVRTMTSIVDALLARDRQLAAGVGGLGLIALLLTGLGFYGAISRLVDLRRREVGVRIALGALRRDVFLLLLGEGCLVLGAGVLGGAGVAGACWRLLQSRIYGVDTAGMIAIIGQAAIVFGVIGVLAVIIPARCTMTVDPAAVLRIE